MKTAVVITVRNEVETIRATLAEVCAQASMTTEIIVVDAGSTDETREVVKALSARDSRVRLLEAEGCTRGHGRNLGIRSSSADIIIVTDAGCIPQPGWFRALTKPLYDPGGPDVVAGYWVASHETAIGRAAACFTTPPPTKINVNGFLPSSRCVAIRRATYERAGGYPDEQFAEDTLFDLRMAEVGSTFRFVPDALVTWSQRETLTSLAKQFYNYGWGSAKLGIHRLRRFKRMIGAMALGVIMMLDWYLALGSCSVLVLGLVVDARRRGCPNLALGVIVGATIRLSALAGEFVGSTSRLGMGRA